MDQSICIQTGKRARSPDDCTDHLRPSKRGTPQHVDSSFMFQGDLFPAENLGLPLEYGHIGTNFQLTDPFLPQDGTAVDFSMDTGLWDYAVDSISPLHTDHLLWPDLLDLPMNGTEQNDMCLDLASALDHQEAREICFGMIYRVQVRATTVQGKTHSELQSAPPSPSQALQLSFLNKQGKVTSESGEEIATLNIKTFRVLDSLQNSMSVRYEAFFTSSDGSGSSSEVSSRNLEIDINIYGQRSASETVATELSKERLFLQDPHWVPDTVAYEKPQDLDLPDFFDEEYQEHPLRQSNEENDEDQREPMDVMDLDYDVIMDNLARHDYLEQATADGRIKTKLEEHQMRGLDFITKRETLTSPSSCSLWKPRDTDDGQTNYQHVITGAKSPIAMDISGGILADDMGLGKSLTMLAAIVGSLKHAISYAGTNTTWSYTNLRGVIAAKSTLLVVPSALLMQNWEEEIEKHLLPRSLRYFKYHGYSRKIELPELLQHDVIITTYGTIAAECNRKQSKLHRVNWFRIVLDEAHMIRNPSTKQFHAVTSLRSCIRWCLTGTPIQNSLDDLGSLVSFLKLPILGETPQFRRHLTNRVQRTKTNVRPDFGNLRSLLGSICLRRNKTVLSLPQTTEHIFELDFSSSERERYNDLLSACEEAVKVAVSGHKMEKKRHTVLEEILRLRLFCNNGLLFNASDPDLFANPEEAVSLLEQAGEAICYYCECDVLTFGSSDDTTSGCLTQCRKVVCGECISRYKIAGLSSKCPICSVLHKPAIATPRNEDSPCIPPVVEYPSKLKKLCEDISTHKHTEKSIVFSFWKRSLDLVGTLLDKHGVHYLRLDGSLPFSRRKNVLSEFQVNQEGMVLLMTLGTGAVGLNNLSVANKVYILEPQWNPSVEQQAIGRVVRLGQSKPVQVIRYKMKGTIETNIYNRQHKKIQLSKGGFTQMLKEILCHQRQLD